MRPKTRSLTPVLLLVLALSGAGVAYMHWTETLESQGVVETGDVTGEWFGAICTEFFDWPWPAEGTGEAGGVDIATVGWDFPEPTKLAITVDNAYPSYSVNCQIEWENTGSVPVVIRGWRFVDDPALESNLENCTLTVTSSGNNLTYECDELTVMLADGVGSQVDPGDVAASSLRFHVEQDDELDDAEGGSQSTTLRFWLQVCASNWNEPQTGGDCFVVDDANDE